MVGALPTSVIVAIGAFLVVMAVVGVLLARRRPIVGPALVVTALVATVIVADFDDWGLLIGLVFMAAAVTMGRLVESRASAEAPEARRRLTIGMVAFGIVVAGALVPPVLHELKPPTTQELVWRTLGGSSKAALALADVPDEELEAYVWWGWAEDLVKVVDAMAERETMAGGPKPEDQERLRGLSRRLTEIGQGNASPGLEGG